MRRGAGVSEVGEQRKLQSLLPPLLHDKTLVVLIQNGIGVEEDVQKMFPDVQLHADRHAAEEQVDPSTDSRADDGGGECRPASGREEPGCRICL